jgi:uncharacterized protein
MKNIITLLVLLISFTNAGAQKISGSWNGKLNTPAGKLTIVFNFSTDSLGKENVTLDSPDQSAKGLPGKVIFISADSVNVTLESLRIEYSGKLINSTIIGKFKQAGYTIPLELKAGEYIMNRPQKPQHPLPYSTEELTFSNKSGTATFSGTLSYPIGYISMKKVPVVIFITGSGLQNRDEELFGHKPFFVIADYLAKNGIASFRYDDRSFGKSTGDVSKLTTQVNADDAEAGIEMLHKLGKFSKVGVIGHSEGGNISFMLAAKKSCDFIVSMAGLAVKGDTALAAQVNRINELSGSPKRTTTEDYRKQIISIGNDWLLFAINYDPTEDIKRIECPVMAINGNKDVQVISELNLNAVRKNLKPNSKNMIKEYPNLNHLFQKCTTGLPNEYSTIEETISPEVLSDIANWIKSLK